MALFYECMPKCARKLLDTADIVRDALITSTKSYNTVARAYRAIFAMAGNFNPKARK